MAKIPMTLNEIIGYFCCYYCKTHCMDPLQQQGFLLRNMSVLIADNE